MIARARRGGRGAGAPGLRRGGARLRRLPARLAARPDGRLLRTYKDGRAQLNAYLEDHAYLVEALLTLYEATFETRWFVEARALADTMIERFSDPEGGFFTTSNDHERLVTRPKDIQDHPIPSGNSSAAFGLLRLAAFTGEREYSGPRARRVPPPPRGRRPAIRRRSGTCSRRCTFTSGPRARSRWSASSLEPLARTCAARSGRRS